MKQDYIAVSDFSPAEIQAMLDLSLNLKKELKAGGNAPILKNKVMGMIFQKPSLRTRVSFDMAMRQLGGDALYLSPNEIGLGQRESIADVARVLSGYVDVIMARVFSHDHILELAKWASVPVVNGLSDYNHPCQGMADALTILEEFGTLKDINVTFIGDGNNVAVSLMHIVAKLGAGRCVDAQLAMVGRVEDCVVAHLTAAPCMAIGAAAASGRRASRYVRLDGSAAARARARW